MKNLRKEFDRLCYRNRNKGIPNLMLYICIGSAVMYLMTQFTGNYLLYNLLCFDRTLILRGQVWRLFTYALTFYNQNLLMEAIGLLCYFSLGRAIENRWGTFRFNLFYLSGIVLMDVYSLIFGCSASVSYLNMSLFLSYATLYPDAHFLLFFIIPIKAWIFALFDLTITLIDVIRLSVPVFYFPYNLFPLVALGNYFLFFGKDVLNVIPLSWRIKLRKLFHKGTSASPTASRPKVIPFKGAPSGEASAAQARAPYLHRCTVCGRTDISDPDLEFRYCSRCKGYYCYCQDHINNHTHIQ